MALIAFNIGDVILVQPAAPLLGCSGLSSFVDVIIGETGTRYFDKFFRWSKDGISWSDYIELTDLNLMTIDVAFPDWLLLEYKYVRAGSDATGTLEFVSIALTGTYSSLNPTIMLDSTCLAEIGYPSIDALAWCQNVYEKLYRKGIVPAFVTRQGDIDLDFDFATLFRTTAFFFAHFVVFARQFERFFDDDQKLNDFINQRGLYTRSDQDLATLVYLMQNYFSEISQRGTNQIYKAADGIKAIDGELLRLIMKNPLDEFMFNLVQNYRFGLWGDSASPEFKGMTDQMNVNKAYEDTADFVNLSLYPIVGTSFEVSIVTDPIKGEVLQIQKDGKGISLVSGYEILVDEDVDYEMTFWVRHADNLDANLQFGAFCYDASGNPISNISLATNLLSNYFVNGVALSNDKYYFFVRCILYNKNEIYNPAINRQLNIGLGSHLKMQKNAKYLLPAIRCVGSDRRFRIHDFKIRPLCSGKCINPLWIDSTNNLYSQPAVGRTFYQGAYSTGFLQTPNFIEMWMQDNSNRRSKDLEEIIRRYLINYNSTFKNIYL